MIEYACPHCNRLLKIRDQYAGLNGRCKHCKNMITVPAAAPKGQPSKPSFEEFTSRACKTASSVTVPILEVGYLVRALVKALMKAHSLTSEKAYSQAGGGLSFQCPQCGPLTGAIARHLVLAYKRVESDVVVDGLNMASFARGHCPGCGAESVVATFDPRQVQAEAKPAKAPARAGKTIADLAAACSGVEFLSSLDISPDQSLLCCVAPGNSVIACDTGDSRRKWSLRVPSSEFCMCRFVGPQRLLVLSQKERDQTLMLLVDTANGAIVDQTLGPRPYFSEGDANPRDGVFAGKKSQDTLLTIQTAGDRIAHSTYQCGQFFVGPKFGPDGNCYVIIHSELYQVDSEDKQFVMPGDHCIAFDASGTGAVYCGGGHTERNIDSALHFADLTTGAKSEIAWGTDPINEIALAGEGRLLLANTVSEVTRVKFPDAVVTMLSLAGEKKEWSLTLNGFKPRLAVILASAPDENWALIQSGTTLKFLALHDGSTAHILPKQPQEIVSARWLPEKRLLYLARYPVPNRPGILECYRA